MTLEKVKIVIFGTFVDTFAETSRKIPSQKLNLVFNRKQKSKKIPRVSGYVQNFQQKL